MLNFLNTYFKLKQRGFVVEPEVLRKNKTSSLVEMGSVCFFFFVVVVVGEQLPGALPPPTDLEYVPLDTSSGLKH